ncbi:biotin carboxylase N-terminal domain-containing protein [Pseudofrankia inefficax]|uniref:Carbamoyl-phosphate synthase L chain ATP-binding protein n=1 Tax=Pseudofrankia inefficax (strain DSM 45817 / CECT 9037 / DDB 130130 / EuI1c) TaxID=298654 RepID=E3J923_PSEI1|nr:biotin carboxylase N-terminal domain-containing protein [Pseudofrankia inefficax]ADP80902.1 Carbamoyl-phosphate synthase L chain ATP-binding protein [Pseudofrankia inefficax]
MIRSLLVANRGEIARRVFRSARAAGLRCVAVYADADADAPFVADADDACRLATGYLDGAAIVAAAFATGADAIHPGYGFLSENAAFAQQVIDAGLTWVGPTPEVISAMGDKLAAKRAAIAAGVPTLPSSDDPADAAGVGYPLLVKAAAGGGGKGMRIVERAQDLPEAVAAAQREALGAFGDGRVFLERYVARSRHVEIQIVGDAHGNLFHLGERECSIQRRHQKIVEESPSPVVTPRLRARMGEAALTLARTLGYRSTGTVEFLLDDETRDFYFLEVNTRLQVEHPVTEEVTGVDLVDLQLQVADGGVLALQQRPPAGHAIEARLYAEDVAAGFLPATGTLAAFEPAADDGVRWDSGVVTGSVVGVDFDPMLAKVVAHAATRRGAARKLATALERLHLGGVTTNRDFLVATLRDEAFLAGDTTTDYIARVRPTPPPPDLARATAVGALWLHGRRRGEAGVLASLPSGWRNTPMPAQAVAFVGPDDEGVALGYRRRRDGSFAFDDGQTARVHRWSWQDIDVEVAGRRATHRVTAAAGHVYVQLPTGTVALAVTPRFAPPSEQAAPGALVAPMPGAVTDVRCEKGDRVEAAQTLVVLEAMKMEHHISAPATGVITEVHVAVGAQVASGALLLVLDLDGSGGGDRTDG